MPRDPAALTLYQVDAFAERPFAGNPAAVCPLAAPASERWMRLVAREMNLSETAFLVAASDAWDLRWFTPAAEVDLCGHATLASAHVLWETGSLPGGEPALFDTRSGRLTARRRGGWIEMDLPADPPQEGTAPDGLAEALGARPLRTARSRLYHLAELGSSAEVEALAPDFAALARVAPEGLVVTAPGGDGAHDVVSRFFAPALGVDEDPVTGSAHCLLGPWWAGRLGRDDLVAYQASERGGVVRIGVRGDRVLVSGRAVTVMRVELLVDPG